MVSASQCVVLKILNGCVHKSLQLNGLLLGQGGAAKVKSSFS